MNEKFKELLNDRDELKELDGYTIYQSEANDKDYDVATDCFYLYKELAEKYGVDYMAYGLDEVGENNRDKEKYEMWDCVASISWEIETKIRKQMNEMIGDE